VCVHEVSPIGRNSGALIGGEPHQNSFFWSFGFCGAKTGFDGLSPVVLVRFLKNFRFLSSSVVIFICDFGPDGVDLYFIVIRNVETRKHKCFVLSKHGFPCLYASTCLLFVTVAHISFVFYI
jgi:hypothetical protein